MSIKRVDEWSLALHELFSSDKDGSFYPPHLFTPPAVGSNYFVWGEQLPVRAIDVVQSNSASGTKIVSMSPVSQFDVVESDNVDAQSERG